MDESPAWTTYPIHLPTVYSCIHTLYPSIHPLRMEPGPEAGLPSWRRVKRATTRITFLEPRLRASSQAASPKLRGGFPVSAQLFQLPDNTLTLTLAALPVRRWHLTQDPLVSCTRSAAIDETKDSATDAPETTTA